jgi:hypothetical protein
MTLTTPSRDEEYPARSGIARLNPKFREAASDHAGMLHPAESRGRVVIAHKDGARWKQRSYDVGDLPEIIPAVAGLEDAYISQQRFYFKRTISQLLQLGAMYVDVDFHTIPELAGMDARGVLEDVLVALERARMPAPTMAIASGRGLYVIWLHEAIPRAALTRWNAAQRELWRVLSPFGGDRGALDAARVLRLAGTKNSKNGATVEQIAPPGEVWKFDDLAEEILPLGREELYDLRIQRAARDARMPSKSRQRPPMAFTQSTLWEGRLTDLQKLRQLRWFEGDLPPGARDHWMFLAGVAMSWIAIPQVLRRELWELSKEAASWNDAESGKRLSAIMKRAHMAAKGERVEWNGVEVDPRYRFRNSTIIELLEIEDWEMEEMSVIISSDEARRRNTKRHEKSRREAGMMERSEYLGIASHNHREAHRLRSEGLTRRQIADTLKLSERWIYKLLSDYVPNEHEQSIPLYGGVALPVGQSLEVRGGEDATTPELESSPRGERRDTGERIPSGEEARQRWGEGEGHPPGCDCLECSSTSTLPGM